MWFPKNNNLSFTVSYNGITILFNAADKDGNNLFFYQSGDEVAKISLLNYDFKYSSKNIYDDNKVLHFKLIEKR